MPDNEQKEPTPTDIATGVANVIDAALGVGVSLARVVAEATALGRKVEPVPEGTPAISAIVRYGVTAMGNLVSAVVSGTQGLKPSVGAIRPAGPTAAAPSSAGRSAGPRVAPGATLRVPLSVENPSDRPMRELRCGSADCLGVIGAERVRFGPECFEVAPHDFEKLTISVSVPPDTPAGDYEVVFALGDSEPDLKMGFAVTAG